MVNKFALIFLEGILHTQLENKYSFQTLHGMLWKLDIWYAIKLASTTLKDVLKFQTDCILGP